MDVPDILQLFVMEAYDDENEDTATPQPPNSIITPMTRSTSARPRSRKCSKDMSVRISRAKTKRRVRTAPPGTLFLWTTTKPQPRRGAISVCEERPSLRRGSRFRQSHLAPATPRLPYLSMSAAKSIIGQRMTGGRVARKTGVKTDGQVRRLSRRNIASEAHGNGSKPPPPARSSYCEKAQLRERRERDKLDPLKILLFSDSDDDLSDTTESMLATPMELHGPGSLGSPIQSPRRSTVVGNDRSSSESTFSDFTVSSKRAKHYSLPLTAYEGWKAALNGTSLAPKAKDKGPGTTVYEPGPIRLEEDFAVAAQRKWTCTKDGRDRVDGLDGMEAIAKGTFDAVALDSIVGFFQELGIESDSSEDCLDRYWVPDERSSRGLRRKAGAAAAAQVQGQAAVSPSTSRSRKSVAPPRQTAQPVERRLSPSPESAGRRGLRSLLKSHRTLV